MRRLQEKPKMVAWKKKKKKKILFSELHKAHNSFQNDRQSQVEQAIECTINRSANWRANARTWGGNGIVQERPIQTYLYFWSTQTGTAILNWKWRHCVTYCSFQRPINGASSLSIYIYNSTGGYISPFPKYFSLSFARLVTYLWALRI